MDKQDIFIQRNKDRMDFDTLVGVFADKFNLDYVEAEEIVMRKKKKRESMGFIKRSGTFKQVDDEGRVWEEIEFDGYLYMVSKIDTTHFFMMSKREFEDEESWGIPATHHVSEFNRMPEFYSNLRQWLKGGEMIGGKSFDESVKKTTPNKNKDNVLTIDEEVTVGDIILEKGDRIKLIKE